MLNITEKDFGSFFFHNSVLFTGGHDKKLFSWSFPDCSQLVEFKGHFGIINCLQVVATSAYPNGVMFSGSDDNDIRSWDITTGQKIKIYRGHTSWVSDIVISGNVLFTASHDKSAMAWEISSGRIMQIYPHPLWVKTLVLGNLVGTDYLFTGCSDGIIRKFNPRSGELLAQLKGHTGGIQKLLLVDKLILYSASDDCTIKAWDIRNLQCMATYLGHSGIVTCLSNDHQFLYSGSYDRVILTWPLQKLTV